MKAKTIAAVVAVFIVSSSYASLVSAQQPTSEQEQAILRQLKESAEKEKIPCCEVKVSGETPPVRGEVGSDIKKEEKARQEAEKIMKKE